MLLLAASSKRAKKRRSRKARANRLPFSKTLAKRWNKTAISSKQYSNLSQRQAPHLPNNTRWLTHAATKQKQWLFLETLQWLQLLPKRPRIRARVARTKQTKQTHYNRQRSINQESSHRSNSRTNRRAGCNSIHFLSREFVSSQDCKSKCLAFYAFFYAQVWRILFSD